MLKSTAFGEFDPLHPCTVPGLFAENLYAEPVVIDAPIELVWEIIIDFDRYPEWNPLNRFFLCDVDDLIERAGPPLWVHGHTHCSMDTQVGRTRIVCNPLGYSGWGENADFDGKLVISVEPGSGDARRG